MNTNIYNLFKIKDKKIKRLVKILLLISFIICLFAIFILIIHHTYFITHILFEIGLLTFRAGLFIGVSAIICGIIFDNYLSNNSNLY